MQWKGAIPERISRLPKDERGYPVPWFVMWENGKPLFPVMDRAKWTQAVKDRVCWVCGEKLGGWLVFVVGPMCGVSRTSAEPPLHRECAEFSVQVCPFLVNPKMKRLPTPEDGVSPGGVMLPRNPGVTLVWATRSFRVFRDHDGNPLITMGEPERIECWREGRAASPEEVAESFNSGLSSLQALATQDGSEDSLRRAVERFKLLLAEKGNILL